MSRFSTKWTGIIPPLITPLKSPDTLDPDGLARLIEHVLSAGVHGLFILGTTGEGPAVSKKIAKEMISRTSAQVAHRVPVYVGVTNTVVSDTLELCACAAEAGADCVVVAPPYYLPPSDEEFLSYLAYLAPRIDLPIFLYNMPGMTKVHLGISTIERAARIPNIVGLKDSSGDMAYFHQLLRSFAGSDFSLLMGHEHLLGEAVLFGASGGVPGGANVAPKWFIDLFHAARTGDLHALGESQKKVLALSDLYQIGKYRSSGIKGIKSALSVLGLCEEVMALPFESFLTPEREAIKNVLQSLRLETNVVPV